MTTAIYSPIVSPYRASDVGPMVKKSMEEIISFICQYKSIDADKLVTKSRERELVYTRQLCMWYIYNITEATLRSIGERFGGRDHTTVIHGKNVIKDLMDANDEVVKRDIEYLNDAL